MSRRVSSGASSMRRISRLFCALLGASISITSAIAISARGEPLPADSAAVQGDLDNGLHYIVVKHSVPPGRATVWVHMHTGSLNETDSQRGIAHYTEHMAFNGSDHFKPGELVPF